MKKFIQEFKTFALRGNVMDMAVGMLIGASFTSIVTSLTENFINPLLQFILVSATYTLADIMTFAGNFISAIINFIITAFVLFCLLKGINKMLSLAKKKEEAPAAAPTTKKCPYCMSEIDINATRCPHCTSQLSEK